MAVAGLDIGPVLRSGDGLYAEAMMAAAQRALELAREIAEARDEALAIRIANAVARAFGGR